jgi:drug/metabolite transporter (DMT)-like permease
MNSQPTSTGSSAPSWMVWTALWIVYIVWGSTYLAIRVTVETLPPLLTGGVRFIFAGSVIFAWLRIRKGKGAGRISVNEMLWSTLIGAGLIMGGNGLVMLAEQDVPSSHAALIIASVPLWVVVLRYILRERVNLVTLLSVLVGFIGVGVLVVPGDKPGDATTLGVVLLLLASLFWASASFFAKRVPLPKDPFVNTATQMVGGGAVTLVAGLLTGELGDFTFAEVSDASVIAFSYLVSMGSLVAFTAYVWLLQNAPISKVATYAYVNPVIAIFLGWALLSEEITATVLVGAAIIVGSVAFTVRKESPPEPTDDAPEPAGALAGSEAG